MHRLSKPKTVARFLVLILVCLPVVSQAALDAGLLEGLSARSLGPAAVSRIGLAQYYVGSTWDAPTDTAAIYIEQARVSLDEAREALNRFMSEDVAAFGSAVDEAGIGLFAPVPPLNQILHEGG